MMLVGPMKKKMVTTVILVIVIMTVIFGVLGYFLLSGKQNQINDLMKKAEVVERYVFTESFPAGHVIDEGDLVLAVVKEESTPSDSYSLETIVNDENREELYRYTGITYKPNEIIDTLETLVGRRLKINVSEKTTLTSEMLYSIDETPSDDLRIEEYTMISLPSDAVAGDYIDVRILFPTGADFSVLVGKKIEKCTDNTVFLKLSEDDVLTMGSAIIEAYMYEGTKLYATKYVDPANQLYNHAKTDYVAKYKTAISGLIEEKENKNLNSLIEKMKTNNVEEYDALVAQYPETYREEIAKQHRNEIKVLEMDITLEEIANYIGLTQYGTQEIREAISKNDEETLNKYKNKIVETKKQLARTYPVKSEVLSVVKNNPNILSEVKANFDKNALISAEISKVEELLYDGVDSYGNENEELTKAYENLVKKVTDEVQLKKDERVKYLNSLIAE